MSTADMPLRYPFSQRGDEVPPECAWLRTHRPVAPVITLAGDNAWVVTSHALAQQVLTDNRFSLYATANAEAPRQYARAFPSDAVSNMANITSTGLRNEVMKTLSPQGNERLLSQLQGTATELLDKAVSSGSPVDLWAEYASPLSSRLMVEILGLPPGDDERLVACSHIAMGTSAHTPAEAARNWAELRTFMAAALRPDPDATGLLPRLAALREGCPEADLSQSQLCDVGSNLMVAGYESLAAFLAHAIILLARNPQQADQLRDNPELMPGALEELYRRNLSIGDGLPRLAAEDVQLGDTLVPAGSLILVCVEAANHDPAVFTEPEQLNFRRHPNPHLSFGGGRHYCPATRLSRVTAQVALETLLITLPAFQLDCPASELIWSWGMIKRIPNELPIRFSSP